MHMCMYLYIYIVFSNSNEKVKHIFHLGVVAYFYNPNTWQTTLGL